MNDVLPERQQRILDFIRDFIAENTYPPTVREIGKGINVKSTSLVTYYLERLEERGLLTRDRDVSRGIRLAEGLVDFFGPETISIPYLGYIVAGEPLPVDTLTQETVELNRALFGRDVADLYALTVQGESMIDALVNDGDLIILRHQERVENGEMAAVWLIERGETTLKKVYYEGHQVRLQPANPTMSAFYVPADQVQVQGKVVMIVRQME